MRHHAGQLLAQVLGLDGRLRNYPGLLLAERAGPGDTWRFVGESDEITRYAVDPRYT
ncbi:hypothetical protein IGA95_33925, partial [Pseudomonas aeruginosa]|nr:hypothetical protein [Pseudomonas aeruginosa]